MALESSIPSRASAARYNSLPDEVLVTTAIEGDEEAFGVLANRHREMAMRTAAQVVGRNGAEDVVQDALLLAFRALRSIGEPAKFSRWLSTITRFRALRVSQKEARKRAGTVRLDENLLETVSSLAFEPRREEEGDQLLLEALERIPPRYAEVLRLHFLHGLPHQRIAEFVDAPLSTVKWRCFRGKELLRIILTAGTPGTARIDDACRRCLEGNLAGRSSCARTGEPTPVGTASSCAEACPGKRGSCLGLPGR